MGWAEVKDWFLGMGQQYHVNPIRIRREIT